MIRLILSLLFTSIIFCAQGSVGDTSSRKGFATISEAGDSLLHYLREHADGDIRTFTLDENMFLAEYRKSDTITHSSMVYGQYLNYNFNVQKGFEKTLKQLKKQNVTVKKLEYDTLLFFANSGDAHFKKCELYFSQRKFKAFISFNLWKVEGLWYLASKMELVTLQEKTD